MEEITETECFKQFKARTFADRDSLNSLIENACNRVVWQKTRSLIGPLK